MVTPRFIRTTDGKLVPVPAPIPTQEVVEVEEVEEETGPGTVEDVGDVTSVSEEDVMGRPEDNLDQELSEDDIEDIFGVSEEDIMGPAPEPVSPKPRVRRIIRRIPPTPPTTLGGIR